MFFEYPIRAEYVSPLMNRPVGVVTLDGRRYYGVVTGFRNGKLVLNGKKRQNISAAGSRRRRKRSKHLAASAGSHPIRQQSVPFGPPVPTGPRVVLNLTSVAVLSALLP